MLAVLEVGAGQQMHCKDGLPQTVVIIPVIRPVGHCCLPDGLKLQMEKQVIA